VGNLTSPNASLSPVHGMAKPKTHIKWPWKERWRHSHFYPILKKVISGSITALCTRQSSGSIGSKPVRPLFGQKKKKKNKSNVYIVLVDQDRHSDEFFNVFSTTRFKPISGGRAGIFDMRTVGYMYQD